MKSPYQKNPLRGKEKKGDRFIFTNHASMTGTPRENCIETGNKIYKGYRFVQ